MRKKFKCYSDPGHGWLKVKRSELKELGIDSDISVYSYQRGSQDVFLEEDCDCSLFVRAYEAKFGRKPIIEGTSSNNMSKIRGYRSYCFYTKDEISFMERVKEELKKMYQSKRFIIDSGDLKWLFDANRRFKVGVEEPSFKS